MLTCEEVSRILSIMEGVPQLIAKLLYGCGIRVVEVVKQVSVRSGKGAKDRFTIFPDSIISLLKNHLAKITVIHEQDLEQDYGSFIYHMHLPANILMPKRNSTGNMFSLQKVIHRSTKRYYKKTPHRP